MAVERALRLHADTDRLRAVMPGRLPGDAVPQTLAIFEPEQVVATLGGQQRELTPVELLALPSMVLAAPP